MSYCYGYLLWFEKEWKHGEGLSHGQSQWRENNQVQESGFSSEAPNKNHFLDLKYMADQENSLDITTDMFKVFSIDGYAFLDPGDT